MLVLYSYHFRISLIALSEYPISPSTFFKSSRVSIFTLPTESQQTPNPYLTFNSDIVICQKSASHSRGQPCSFMIQISLYYPLRFSQTKQVQTNANPEA